MARQVDVPRQLAERHAGHFPAVAHMPQPGQGLSTETKGALYGDAALIIPDTIAQVRQRIKATENGIMFHGATVNFPTYDAHQTATDDFLRSANAVVGWIQDTYRGVMKDIHAEAFVHPEAATAISNLNSNLPNIADRDRIPWNTAEEFLQPGAESAFYVFNALIPAVARAFAPAIMTVQDVVDAFRSSTLPLTLATGIHAKNIVPVLNGMQRGHTGRGFNPGMLQVANGVVHSKYSAEELTEMFGSDQTEPQGICPAAVSRRHVFGSHLAQLQNQFPDSNAVLAAQNLVADVLQLLLT